MNFKEALIAHLQGEQVEVRVSQMDTPWEDFIEYHRNVQFYLIDDQDFAIDCEYRLKPCTITVNGREVQAGEEKPPIGEFFFVDIESSGCFGSTVWGGTSLDRLRLERGLVHLTKEAAIAHARAMLNIPESAENEICE